MINKKLFFGLLILLVGVISCDKTRLGDCFKSSGKLVIEERALVAFHGIRLYDNVDLVIKSGPEPKCIVKSGENLIAEISTKINDQGFLEIHNLSSCNWTRSFDQELSVTVFVQRLDSIEYRSIGNVSTPDTLIQDSLVVALYEGAGRVELLLKSEVVSVALHYGTQELLLSGITGVAYAYSASFGLIDTQKLVASLMYVNSRSSNHMYVRALTTLEVSIESLGNVYYFGEPGNIVYSHSSSGVLIHQGS